MRQLADGDACRRAYFLLVKSGASSDGTSNPPHNYYESPLNAHLTSQRVLTITCKKRDFIKQNLKLSSQAWWSRRGCATVSHVSAPACSDTLEKQWYLRVLGQKGSYPEWVQGPESPKLECGLWDDYESIQKFYVDVCQNLFVTQPEHPGLTLNPPGLTHWHCKHTIFTSNSNPGS